MLNHPDWRDVETSVNSTKRLLKIARETKRKVHVLHISTKDEISILKEYKDFCTCEVTPSTFIFSFSRLL